MEAYDAFLQKWVSPYEEIYADTRYGRTYIIASGEKKHSDAYITQQYRRGYNL